ncbi:MAG: dihydroorotate dehydrogenase [Deltaproteobacteria bacterium]|nr:dihydroorotate dehydrogenase [Deltaproteobacteria bacterium]
MNGSPDMSVTIGHMRMKNPVMPAAGTFGYGEEYAQFLDLNQLGAVIVKTITQKPRIGSYPFRSTEVPSGLLATIGLQNVGIEKFINEKLPYFSGLDVPLIVNIGGLVLGDYIEVAEIIDRQYRVDGIEVNISCPNLDRGGMHFGVDPRITRELVYRIRQATSKVLIIKLTPMVTDIRQLAEICQESGADALSLINSPLGMAIDIKTRRSRLGRNITGGIAGPAIKPLALYLVWQVCRAVDIPVIGIGGISSTEDALEFIIAGASAVQIGTWNFVNPGITVEVIKGIEAYMREQGIGKLSDLVGSFRTS